MSRRHKLNSPISRDTQHSEFPSQAMRRCNHHKHDKVSSFSVTLIIHLPLVLSRPNPAGRHIGGKWYISKKLSQQTLYQRVHYEEKKWRQTFEVKITQTWKMSPYWAKLYTCGPLDILLHSSTTATRFSEYLFKQDSWILQISLQTG